MSSPPDTINTGLNDVAVCASNISVTSVDERGVPHLTYRGRSIADVVKGSFEEAVLLLLSGRTPDRREFEEFDRLLKEHRALDRRIVEHIAAYPANANRMDFLLTALSFGRMFDEDYENLLWRNPKADPAELADLIRRAGVRMGAKIPTIIAHGHRILQGQDPIPPDRGRSHAANLLSMMGIEASPEDVRAFEATLILYLDHTITNSTFIARVAESARTDPYGPLIAAGVGLKGVLHGGANEMTCHQFDEIGSPANAERYVREKFRRGEILFGFGHRLAAYKMEVESRVGIAEGIAREITRRRGQGELMETYDRLVAFMASDAVEEGRRRAPNLDLPVSVIYRTLCIPLEWNTPIFQASRHFGWVAHMQQQRLDRCPLYRPTQRDLPPGG